MNPNDVIDTIIDAIDYAEISHDPGGLAKARRLLKNDLRQVIDQYVQDEVARAQARRRSVRTVSIGPPGESAPWQNVHYR